MLRTLFAQWTAKLTAKLSAYRVHITQPSVFKYVLSSLLVLLLSSGLLSSCAIPRVSAEDRLFLDVSVALVDNCILPKQSFEGEPVGGLSAIAYDIPNDRLYALSDNRDRPRFYTLKLTNLSDNATLSIESVTYLKDNQGNPYAPGELDPEGLVLSPTGTLLISSEGSPKQSIAPAIGEYDRTTGQLQKVLPLPQRYIPDSVLAAEAAATESVVLTEQGQTAQTQTEQTQGVQENLSFESLALNVSSGTGGVYEPYRLFVATEGPLLQDLDFAPEVPYKNRLLHYMLDPYQTEIISEHLYEMDLAPTGAVLHGLSEIEVLDQGGHFLALERSYGFQGFVIKLYQLAAGGATDISAIASLQGDTSGISPIRKELILDLASLPVTLQNYEAMTFGPTLASGKQSLLIMSDDNFVPEQESSLLIFELDQS
ncbi:MAG: esterase-like activity of phytase family protein [Cyanobacteria bacterium P01_A01_bin.116]